LDKAGSVLNHLLHNLLQKKQNKQGTVFYHFFNKWELIVGKRLYGHTKIEDLKNGNLYVAVDHPGWIQMLRMQERRIVRSIGRTFPQLQVKSLRINVNEALFKLEEKKDEVIEKKEGEKVRKRGENDKKGENNSEEIKGIEEIKNKELQNVLKRLYMSLLKKEEES
jgi:hypothetical protein